MVNSPVVFCEIIFLAVSIFNDKLVDVVIVACFSFNAVSNPFVRAMVKLPSVIVFCFKFILSCKFVNEDCKFKILGIVISLSFIIFVLNLYYLENLLMKIVNLKF